MSLNTAVVSLTVMPLLQIKRNQLSWTTRRLEPSTELKHSNRRVNLFLSVAPNENFSGKYIRKFIHSPNEVRPTSQRNLLVSTSWAVSALRQVATTSACCTNWYVLDTTPTGIRCS